MRLKKHSEKTEKKENVFSNYLHLFIILLILSLRKNGPTIGTVHFLQMVVSGPKYPYLVGAWAPMCRVAQARDPRRRHAAAHHRHAHRRGQVRAGGRLGAAPRLVGLAAEHV